MKEIESEGYEFNPRDTCAVNKITSEKQRALAHHVEEVKSSRVNSKANDKLRKWDEKKWRSDALGRDSVTCGKYMNI